MGSLVTLAIYAAMAAAALFVVHTAWSHFTGTYKAEGAATQLAEDTKILESVKADRDQWKKAEQDREAENADMQAKLDSQSAAIKALGLRAEAAQKLTVAAIARQRQSQAAFDQAQATDRGIVLTAQPKRPAEEELKLIDTLVLDALGLKKPEPAK